VSDFIKADICVIGAGSGGLSVASGSAQLGRKTVLIERGEMGGDCLNTGCVPSKALLAAAKHAEMMRHASQFGIADVEPNIDAARLHSQLHEIIATIAPHDSQERFEGLGVKVIRASARFADSRTIEAANVRIRARRFVIATGSRASIPPIPGLDQIPFFTNETIFEKDFIPSHLIVIGAGPVGIELAQAHRRLGAQVSIVETQSALPKEDKDLAAIVLAQLQKEGVALYQSTQVTSVKKSDAGIVLTLLGPSGSRTLEGSHVLVATGRKPNIEDLGLESAGVALNASGIVVDKHLKTSNRRIYAIGDVSGAPQFTHVASYHASLVIRHAFFRQPIHADHANIPRVVFTEPELAQVGLLESEARTKRKSVRIITSEFSGIDRAVAERKTEGMIKLVVQRGGRILGAGIVGPNAGELIWPWALAISQEIKLSSLAGSIVPYPTLSDISKRAAGSYYTSTLFGRGSRLLVSFLSLFG
jgi:pyruvate/2-oxoglutarate dehydrogenase complex dihydrolipoamide dehydrogenase (E3) component